MHKHMYRLKNRGERVNTYHFRCEACDAYWNKWKPAFWIGTNYFGGNF